MSLGRCPRCRSWVDPDKRRWCVGCGDEVPSTLPPSKNIRKTAFQEGSKDAAGAFTLLSIIGALGIMGFIASFFSGHGYMMIVTASSAVVGSVSWIIRTNRRGPGNQLELGCRIILTLFFLGLALLFGLGILLGVTCVRGGGFE